MSWKRGNPGCPCCTPTCPKTTCSDGVTQKQIVTRTLELLLPNTLIFMLPSSSQPVRDIFISTGWASINGTYTWNINANCIFPGTFEGVEILQERRTYSNFDGLATCANYQTFSPLSTNYQVLDKSLFVLNFGSLTAPNYIFPSTFTPYYRIFFDPPPGLTVSQLCEETAMAVRVAVASPSGEFCSFPGATAIARFYE